MLLLDTSVVSAVMGRGEQVLERFRNARHFQRLDGLPVEDWAEADTPA